METVFYPYIYKMKIRIFVKLALNTQAPACVLIYLLLSTAGVMNLNIIKPSQISDISVDCYSSLRNKILK